MKTRRFFPLLVIVFLLISSTIAAAKPTAQAIPSDWSDPAVIYQEAWEDAIRIDMSDDGTRMVALQPNSGSSNTTRHVIYSEKVDGVWQEPVTIAENGNYSNEPFQWLPQVTHAVISGDGNTIIYVGYTGTTNGLYIINRDTDSWSAPALIATGFDNTHYWVSLSQDGDTLAVCNYPFLDIQYVFVLTRDTEGAWSAPVQIGIGGMPSLSADGKKLAYIYNAQVAFSEKTDTGWSAPITLTENISNEYSAEFPQMSADGKSLYYWMVTLVPDGPYLVRTEQNLFVFRRLGSGWSEAQQINSEPVIPSGVMDGPAAADAHATRFVYPFPILRTDPDGTSYIDASQLRMAEFTDGDWQTSVLVDQTGWANYNKWPVMLADGKTLNFESDIFYSNGIAVYNAVWQMTTDDDPPLPVSTSVLITSAGGTLSSDIDGVVYTFPAGAFSTDTLVTHTYLPNQTPPPGKGGLGHGFSITAVDAETNEPVQPVVGVTVTIPYGDSGCTAIAGTLGVWWWDGTQWLLQPGEDDPVNHVVTATLTHFSEYGIFGDTHQVFLPLLTR